MTPADIAEVISIGSENGLSHWSARSYLSEIDNRYSITQSLKYRKKVAGFIVTRLIMSQSYNSSSYEAEILHIAVSKHLQNKGLGQILLDGHFEVLGKRNVSEIWLEVRETNLQAIGFYKKNGFSVRFERKNYYTDPLENALVMKKTLNSVEKSVERQRFE